MLDIKDARTSAAALIALGAAIGTPQKNPHPGGKAFVIVPGEDGAWKVEYLEQPERPVRKSGTVLVDDTASFIAGANRYFAEGAGVIYASLEPAQFVVVLNEHQEKSTAQSSHDGANWRDHRVSYTLKHSKEWELWSKTANGHDMSQEQLAFFIEDNLPDFKNPQGAKMLEIATNFRVKQGVTFKGGFRPHDGQVQLEYTEQNEGGAGSSGNMKIPETFTIEIPVWKGIDAKPYAQDVRLRYRVNGGALSIRMQGIRPHKTIQRAFSDVLEVIKGGVKKAPVIFGTPGS